MAGASVFATNTFLVSQVTYGNTNVENALNDLYTLKGNDENYSTDEKIVGKWIDGKPIYRKIILCTSPSAYNELTTFYTFNEDINTFINIHGMLILSTGAHVELNSYQILSPGISFFVYGGNFKNTQKNKIVGTFYTSDAKNTNIPYLNADMTIIVEYTKK